MVRYFALRTSSAGREEAVFTGRQPRQAALKAASASYSDIFLRERGTNKLHHFRGSRSRVRAPENKPAWMPNMVWKPNVRKLGVVHMERKRSKAARGARARRGARRTRRARRR